MSAHVCIYAILQYILYTKNMKKLIKKRGYHQLKVQHFIMPDGCLCGIRELDATPIMFCYIL
jgi:hypothetical protein